MFSCSEFFKACDSNSNNRIQPQRVPQQANWQYQQPSLREQPQNFSTGQPNQSQYAEEKAISAGLQGLDATLNQAPAIEPPAALVAEPQSINFTVPNDLIAEAEKPPPEPLELGPAPTPPTYQLQQEMPVAPPPPQQRPAPGPDLKEPEPEQNVECDMAKEFKKASIATGSVAFIFLTTMVFLVMRRTGFDTPTCPEEEWYKLNNLDKPRSCEECGHVTNVVPIGGEWELTWPKYLRAFLYLTGLCWMFLGIAIVCDQFMAAIEEITSKSRVVWVKVHGDTKHKFHKKVWNDTVANLTLMALGSSAPEILLSVIELLANNFFAGELGPSTIVGSAAFNLLVITAICVAAIPAPDVRRIDGLAVFTVTASLSIFAYVWLIIILQMTTPDVVTKTEAFLTLSFFPMLVILAFCADKGYFGLHKGKAVVNSHIFDEQSKLEKMYSKKISFETVKMMVEDDGAPKVPRMTKAQYRRQVMRSVMGGAKDASAVAEVTCGFVQSKIITLECAGTLDVIVRMGGRCEGKVEVRYATQDGLAFAGKRYTHTEGVFVFQPGEIEKYISIPIIDNEVWEEQEDFWINLEGLNKDGESPNDKLGYGIRNVRVVILNDDEPGTLCFFVDEVLASRNAESVQIGVSRTNGSTGRISCQYNTIDDTAVKGSNYTEASGQLTFEEGVCKASIEIGIAPLGKTRKSDIPRVFRVVLSQASEGVKFDADTDGGTDSSMCDVMLPGAELSAFTKCCQLVMCDIHCTSSMPAWRGQFVSAFYCNGTPADQSSSSKTDWIFHMVSQPFKYLFAFVPPAQICGGWACFAGALAMIGAVTMVVGEMAALMGCCLDIPDDITAITVVALGTSVPDMFASKSAALHDPNADNSIGNVTGSNCVNVFLGLGLPWSVAALYWDMQGKTADWIKKDYKGDNYEEKWGSACPDGCFLVPAGSLSFSVTIFTCTAVTCVTILAARRVAYGGELGGPAAAAKRDAAILVSLWFVYIIVSILKSLKVI